MTPAQERSIERIKRQIVKTKSSGEPSRYEFKKFEISDRAGSPLVFLVTEYGLTGDAGTAAGLLCRDYRHFMIGKRGGVQIITLSANLRTSMPARVRGVFAAVNYWHSPEKPTAARANLKRRLAIAQGKA